MNNDNIIIIVIILVLIKLLYTRNIIRKEKENLNKYNKDNKLMGDINEIKK